VSGQLYAPVLFSQELRATGADLSGENEQYWETY